MICCLCIRNNFLWTSMSQSSWLLVVAGTCSRCPDFTRWRHRRSRGTWQTIIQIIIILGAKQRVHRLWGGVEFAHAAAAAAAAIAKNTLYPAGALSTFCSHAATIAVADPLSVLRWLAAATCGEYTYAQRQTFCNFGFMDIIRSHGDVIISRQFAEKILLYLVPIFVLQATCRQRTDSTLWNIQPMCGNCQ